MKKICAISTISTTLNAFVIDAMWQLKAEGYEVTLIASMDEEFLKKYQREFNCINIPMCRGISIRNMIKSIILFYGIFKRERFDYVQYATPNASFYASIASFFAGCPRRVYCQWGIRYVGFSGLKRLLFKAIEIITCKLSTHIRPASLKNLHFAVSEGHYKANKAAIIGNGGTIGVDFSIFDKAAKLKYKTDVFQKYPILEGKFIYGFIGRLDKDKGINELFSSYLKLKEQYENIALLVVGPVDKTEGINSELFQKVKACKSVIFTGFTNEVVKYLSTFDVLVHPSYREGFSMVIQQAMAMEVAVITTDIPGPSEVIEENKSGLLVPAKNTKSLNKAMEMLLLTPSLKESMAISGYERASKLFNRRRMLQLTIRDRKQILGDI